MSVNIKNFNDKMKNNIVEFIKAEFNAGNDFGVEIEYDYVDRIRREIEICKGYYVVNICSKEKIYVLENPDGIVKDYHDNTDAFFDTNAEWGMCQNSEYLLEIINYFIQTGKPNKKFKWIIDFINRGSPF
jgi:hypothetical protein